MSIRAHLDNGLGLGVAHSWFTGGTEYDARGNVEVSVAYRRTWLELGLVRVGVGGQIGEGLATEETDDAPALQQLQNLALRMPFHEGEIAPRTPFQASVEARIELVGCHVPFLHVKAGFLHWKVFDIHAYSVPLSLTLGGFYRPWFGVGASVEVDLRTPDELFEARRVTRVAALADFWPCRGFHILVNAAALSGELTGVELGVTLSVVRSHWSEGE